PKRVRLEAEFDDDLPALAIDAAALTQAALNLITNASDAIGDSGRIRISAARAEDQMIHFSVSDDGAGMSDEARRHALDPFFTTKRRRMSTGLGLSLVRGVVQRVGGEVRIDSSPGRGSTVTLVLPSAGAILNRAPTARIDVADDRIAGAVADVLESQGYRIAPTLESTRDGGCLLAVLDSASELQQEIDAGRSAPVHRIVLGPDPGGEPSPHTTFIDPKAGFSRLRTALENAARNAMEKP
ncbi:MAG: ATP-binding protein, partial [Planctomycetota bacterium]|nr:ATP-binding protein [Planctomycetota bacterium]